MNFSVTSETFIIVFYFQMYSCLSVRLEMIFITTQVEHTEKIINS